MDFDRLGDKFARLNEEVAREQRRTQIRDAVDSLVLEGKLGYDPERDVYWRLPEYGENTRD